MVSDSFVNTYFLAIRAASNKFKMYLNKNRNAANKNIFTEVSWFLRMVNMMDENCENDDHYLLEITKFPDNIQV